MKSKILVVLLALLLLAAGGLVTWYAVKLAGEQQAAAGKDEADFGGPLAHFQLTQSTGDAFDSQSLEGKIWIASFFYATCPTECRHMNEAKRKLAVEFGHRGVKFVSITCDAEIDTPLRLTEEVRRYNADTDTWYFLTGNQQYIEKVGADIFKVYVQPKGHSPHLMVVDRQGEIQGYFNFKQEDQMRQLRELVNKLLLEENAAA